MQMRFKNILTLLTLSTALIAVSCKDEEKDTTSLSFTGSIKITLPEYMEKGSIVLFACGTGQPFFSTDTAAVLRAAEIHADAILLAKNIDGVYSDDPRKNPDAVKFDEISYDEVLARHLAVMDTTATSLAMDNSIPVIVFGLAEPENIVRVLQGEKIGTTVR